MALISTSNTPVAGRNAGNILMSVDADDVAEFMSVRMPGYSATDIATAAANFITYRERVALHGGQIRNPFSVAKFLVILKAFDAPMANAHVIDGEWGIRVDSRGYIDRAFCPSGNDFYPEGASGDPRFRLMTDEGRTVIYKPNQGTSRMALTAVPGSATTIIGSGRNDPRSDRDNFQGDHFLLAILNPEGTTFNALFRQNNYGTPSFRMITKTDGSNNQYEDDAAGPYHEYAAEFKAGQGGYRYARDGVVLDERDVYDGGGDRFNGDDPAPVRLFSAQGNTNSQIATIKRAGIIAGHAPDGLAVALTT